MSTFDHVSGFAAFFPNTAIVERCASFREIYEANRQRIYALSFWMTDNELTAEELMERTFCRAFSRSKSPSPEMIDRSLISELREIMSLGDLTLQCDAVTELAGVRRNTKRIHLERAIVQLPSTERLVFLMHDVEGYDHARIGRNLGLTEDASCEALHQARLRLRELLASIAEQEA